MKSTSPHLGPHLHLCMIHLWKHFILCLHSKNNRWPVPFSFSSPMKRKWDGRKIIINRSNAPGHIAASLNLEKLGSTGPKACKCAEPPHPVPFQSSLNTKQGRESRFWPLVPFTWRSERPVGRRRRWNCLWAHRGTTVPSASRHSCQIPYYESLHCSQTHLKEKIKSLPLFVTLPNYLPPLSFNFLICKLKTIFAEL